MFADVRHDSLTCTNGRVRIPANRLHIPDTEEVERTHLSALACTLMCHELVHCR